MCCRPLRKRWKTLAWCAGPLVLAPDPFPAGAPAPRKPSVSLFEAHGDPFASPAKDPFPVQGLLEIRATRCLLCLHTRVRFKEVVMGGVKKGGVSLVVSFALTQGLPTYHLHQYQISHTFLPPAPTQWNGQSKPFLVQAKRWAKKITPKMDSESFWAPFGHFFGKKNQNCQNFPKISAQSARKNTMTFLKGPGSPPPLVGPAPLLGEGGQGGY